MPPIHIRLVHVTSPFMPTSAEDDEFAPAALEGVGVAAADVAADDEEASS